MAKWNILVYTKKGFASYSTDSDERKSDIFKKEKAKKDVIEIYINNVRSYKK